MLPLAAVLAAVLDIPHLFRVAARQHLGHQVVVVGRLVARMGALKRLPMVSKDLLENIPVPRGGCYHRIAPSWGDQLVAVPRLYHASAASSTPHRPVYAHPHPLLSSETGATEIGKMHFPIRSRYPRYRGGGALRAWDWAVQVAAERSPWSLAHIGHKAAFGSGPQTVWARWSACGVV